MHWLKKDRGWVLSHTVWWKMTFIDQLHKLKLCSSVYFPPLAITPTPTTDTLPKCSAWRWISSRFLSKNIFEILKTKRKILTHKRCGWIWWRICEMFDKQEDYSLAYSRLGWGWMHIILYYIIFLYTDPTKSTFTAQSHAISSLLLFVNQDGCRLISFCSLIKQHKNKIVPFSAHRVQKLRLPLSTSCINPP